MTTLLGHIVSFRRLGAAAAISLVTMAVAAGCGTVTRIDDAAVAADAPLVDAPAVLPVGDSCAVDADCGSGTCAQGVCCATACEGGCLRCDLPGQRGACAPVAAAEPCGVATCDEAMATAAPRCDGHGACLAGATSSCGAYVCADDTTCAAGCVDDTTCSAGNVCARGACMPPTCDDGVRSPPETGVDCGGGACPRCVAGLGCTTGADCQSGTCDATTNTCTTPTYGWRTASFGACTASACSLGVQTRTVWCERSDGATVDDALCTGARPVQSQSCTNTAGCSWFAGSYGACSQRCGGGTMTRPVYCRDGAGAQVPSAWCAGPPPIASASCNTFTCTVQVVAGPSPAMGPCWAPPTCQGGYPSFPDCPPGYAPTRSELACGNPNSCGSSWALCTFFAVAHYGCANPSYVMGIAARECTFQ